MPVPYVAAASLIGGIVGWIYHKKKKTALGKLEGQPAVPAKYCELAATLNGYIKKPAYSVAVLLAKQIDGGAEVSTKLSNYVTKVGNICSGAEPVPNKGVEGKLFEVARAIERSDVGTAITLLVSIPLSGIGGWQFK